jgi:5-methylcytosine-specific restriction endonuclease McrA
MAVVRVVLKRDGYQCVIAGDQCLGEASTADHRANRGNGGSKVLNDPRALIAACGICNGLKEDSSGQEREELIRRGVKVQKAATNAQTLVLCQYTPVEYPDGAVWFLTTDGRRVDEQSVPF